MATKHWTHGLITALTLCQATACGGGDGGGGDDSGRDEAGASASAGTGAGGDGSAGPAAGEGGAAGSDEPVATGPLFGPFDVKFIAATAVGVAGTPRPARTELAGLIRDGVQPDVDGWEMLDERGDCQLYAPNPPFCDPKCAVGTESCAVGDQCLPLPAKQTAGMVTVEGLGEPFELEDKVVGNYAIPTGFTLPYAPCMEGDPITLRADGAGQGAFSLQVPCLATLDAPELAMIERGKPTTVRWPAPAMPELATMHLHLDISHHGGSRGKLECETDDDGEVEIDAELIDGLITLGVAGFPTVVLTRGAEVSGTSPANENVRLRVTSTYESPVGVQGVVSCTDSAECPEGQTCGTDLLCQ